MKLKFRELKEDTILRHWEIKHPEDYQQFIGETDKNGVEIYLGDKVKWHRTTGLVMFKEGGFFVADKKGGYKRNFYDGEQVFDWNEVEVLISKKEA